jgi:hypothetical protein
VFLHPDDYRKLAAMYQNLKLAAILIFNSEPAFGFDPHLSIASNRPMLAGLNCSTVFV